MRFAVPARLGDANLSRTQNGAPASVVDVVTANELTAVENAVKATPPRRWLRSAGSVGLGLALHVMRLIRHATQLSLLHVHAPAIAFRAVQPDLFHVQASPH